MYSRNLNHSTFPTLDNIRRLLDGRIQLALRGNCFTPRLTGCGGNTGIIRRRVERDIEICGKSATVHNLFSLDLTDLVYLTSMITRSGGPEAQTPLVHSIRRC